jgi:hypothetical protein
LARRWEPWHFGYTGGPPPCSDAGDQVGMPPGDGEPEPPVLNNKFVPYVRGNRYTEIGSTGA